jgi:hypothetical protein
MVNVNPVLKQESLRIAWDFLYRANQVDDPAEAIRFLSRSIDVMMEYGVGNRLILSNLAISAYERFRSARTIEIDPANWAS